MMQHFISINDTTPQQINAILDTAITLRKQRVAGEKHDPVLAGKTLALIFEKPSLRTRVSFEQAIYELGGNPITLGQHEVGLGKRESVADVARVLGGMVHGIIARVFEHQKLIDLAQYSGVPTINALSDHSHPAQALADVLTMIDAFGRDIQGRRITFVGDGNNVAVSLACICSKLKMRFVLSSPLGYGFSPRFEQELAGMDYRYEPDPAKAVSQADAVYADTWVSMGQEEQKAKREMAFAPYQINDALLAHCPEHAIVLHCLPAYRGIEITDSVMDGLRSQVFTQAHNRLHAQKGLLVELFDEAGK